MQLFDALLFLATLSALEVALPTRRHCSNFTWMLTPLFAESVVQVLQRCFIRFMAITTTRVLLRLDHFLAAVVTAPVLFFARYAAAAAFLLLSNDAEDGAEDRAAHRAA